MPSKYDNLMTEQAPPANDTGTTVDYDSLMSGDQQGAAASHILGVKPIPPANAAEALRVGPRNGVPASVAMHDPAPVKGMDDTSNAIHISLTNPAMARWAAGDPAHVAASQDHFEVLDYLSKAWDRLKDALYVLPDKRDKTFKEATVQGFLEAPEEISRQFKGSLQAAGGAIFPTTLEEFVHAGSSPLGPATVVALDLLAAAWSPVSGTLTSVIGRPVEQATGVRREITGAILTLLAPAAAVKGFKTLKAFVPTAEEAVPAKLNAPGTIEGKFEEVHPTVDIAENNATIIDGFHEIVSNSELNASSPETMAEFIRQQVAGTPAAELKISFATVMAAYRAAGMIPHPKDGILGWVPGLETQMAAASASGGDIRVPTDGYMTNVSEAGHVALREGVSAFETPSIKEAEGLASKPVEGAAAPAAPEGIRDRIAEVAPAIKEAVDRAKNEAYLSPLFKDAKTAGMTEGQFNLYSKKLEELDAAIYAKMHKLVSGQIERERGTEWKARAAQVEPVVRGQLGSSPDYAVRHFLATGALPDGRTASAGPIKLDRASVIETYPELVDNLPKSIFGPNGVSADDIAEVFGFRNGESMLQAIINLERLRAVAESVAGKKLSIAEHFDRLVKLETARRVNGELGDFLSPESIDTEARAAVRIPDVERLLIDELQALAKAAGLPFDKASIKAQAEAGFEKLDVTTAKNIKYHERLVGRAGREAEVALLKGKFVEAFQAKQRQLIVNTQLGLAHDFVKEFNSFDKKARSWAARVPTVGGGQPYLDWTHQILSEMEYSISRQEVELQEAITLHSFSFDDFAQRSEDDGLPFQNAGITAGRPGDMSVEEFRSNATTLEQLVNLDKFMREIDVLGKKIAHADVVDRYVKQRTRVGDKFVLDELLHPNFKARSLALWRSANGPMKVMEFLLDYIDGHDFHGVMNDTIVRGMQASKHHEDDMLIALGDKFKDFSKRQPKGWEKRIEKKISVPLYYTTKGGSTVRPIKTVGDLIGAALHYGNEENWAKLTKGYLWNSEAVLAEFDKHLIGPDWDFVQFYWKAGEEVWEASREMYKRINGLAPPSVKPRPFTNVHGTWEGGHAPIFFDSLLGKNVAGELGVDTLFGNKFLRSVPANGYKTPRTGYLAPVDLSLELLQNRLVQMVHDVAFREAILNSAKVLRDPVIKEGLTLQVGPEYVTQLSEWLKRLSGAKDFDDKAFTFFNKFLKGARSNFVTTSILWRMTTVMKHGITAFAKSSDEVGMNHLLKGYQYMIQNDWKNGWQDSYHQAAAESPEIRRRYSSIDRDLREHNNRIFKKQGFIDELNRLGGIPITLSDQFSAVPTYFGAKLEAKAQGMSELDAIAYGDKAVRRAHGASHPVDLANALDPRGPYANLMKLFTMFTTFMNNGYNRVLQMGENVARIRGAISEGDFISAGGNFMGLLIRSWWVIGMAGIIDYIVSEEKKEDESFLEKFAFMAARTVAAGLPLGAETVKVIAHGGDFEATPLERAFTTIKGTFKDVISLATGEGVSSRKPIQHAFETIGYLTGAVSGQFGQTGQYIWDYISGDEDPDNIGELIHGLIYGPSPKGK